MNVATFDQIPADYTASFTRTIAQADVDTFSALTGDTNSLHLDATYAASTKFGKPVSFGLLTQSFLSTLAGMYIPGKFSIILNVTSNFREPVFVGDTLTISGSITQKQAATKTLLLKTTITNQKGSVVLSGTMLVGVLQ